MRHNNCATAYASRYVHGVREALRIAYAKGQEEAAKVCDARAADRPSADFRAKRPEECYESDAAADCAAELAAAIRALAAKEGK